MAEPQTIELDPWGGQQEARGNSNGAEWYVENIREDQALDMLRRAVEAFYRRNLGSHWLYF